MLRMLYEFDILCRKEGLHYYLFFGSLLGAVRHHGFIPWDDDIDIAMPREDYNKLLEISCDWVQSFDFLCFEKDDSFPFYFGKLSDKGTEIENTYIKKVNNLGIYIDVFPMDRVNIPHDEEGRFRKKIKQNNLILKLSSMRKFWPADNKKKTVAKFFGYLLAKAFGTDYWIKKRNNLINAFAFKGNRENCRIYVCGMRLLDTCWFEGEVLLPFEKIMVACPNGYKDCLKAIYGDYMKAPPEEKRMATHDFMAYYRFV